MGEDGSRSVVSTAGLSGGSPRVFDASRFDFGQLLLGRALPAAHAYQQHRLLQRRVRMLACTFAVTLMGWLAVEVATLGGALLAGMSLLRLALGSGLLLLARYAGRLPPLAGLWLLVLLQAVAFGLMRELLAGAAPDWLQTGYRMAPFVIVAQLALLPLATLHLFALALPAFALAIWPLLGGSSQPLHSGLADLWLLSLLLLMSSWSGSAQLALLLNLLSARWDADHDGLTGLANRRSLLERLHAAAAGCRRRGTPLSVVMFDLDRFKRINDQHGHGCGDAVLRNTAATLQQALRANDSAGRIGGEEFVAVLPDTGLAEAVQVAERVRRAVAAMETCCDHHLLRITISAGVAERLSDEPVEPLLQRADGALYAAKAGGRDRVETASDPADRAPASGPSPIA